MSGYGTAWQETEALLAVQHSMDCELGDDYAEARRILVNCSPAELSSLADVAFVLHNLCQDIRREKRKTALREMTQEAEAAGLDTAVADFPHKTR